MIDLELQEARQRTAELEREATAEARQQRINELDEVRTQLAKLRSDFEPRAVRLKQADNERADLKRRIWYQRDEISAHLQQRPAIYGYLPNDPACKQWQREHDVLEARVQGLTARLKELPDDRERFELVQLHAEISRLEYAEQNLLNQLDGSLGKWPAGGLFGVL